MLFTYGSLSAAERRVLDRTAEMRKSLRFYVQQEPRRWSGLLARMTRAKALRASSSIEGIHVSAEDALAAVDNEDAADADKATWHAVCGYHAAMDYLLQRCGVDEFHFSLDVILAVHFMISRHDLKANPGRLRPGWIGVHNSISGDLVHEGVDRAQLEPLLSELVEYLKLSTQPSFRAILGKEEPTMGRSSSAARPQKRDADTKLAQSRLSVLELARELGNVAEACRQRGLDRTSFYEWKRRFQTQGFEGLKDLPPIHRSHPQTTPEPVVDRIKALALSHPAYGCNRHEAMLALEGIRVSAITIQKILNDNGLGTKVDRWLALETANAGKAIEITAEQAAFLEKLNPCFRERHVESAAPGELLSADTFFVGSLKGVGRVYLHAVVDTYGSYAFGFLHVSKQPEAAVAVLHNDVLPFYRNLDLPVTAILTDNGREFCGTERHPYELYLDLNGIEHRRTRVRTPKTNGFVERFNGTVLDEFFRVTMRETFYDSVEALQADLDAWLVHHNTERPHLGYRNMGRRPIETVMSFVSQEG